MRFRFALVKWAEGDGVYLALHNQLTRLGHEVIDFSYNQPVPKSVDVVLSFAPYNRFIQIPLQISRVPRHERPIYIHWDTEANLNPSEPWMLQYFGSQFRSWLGRRESSEPGKIKSYENKLNRLRYFGDYIYCLNKGWIDVLAVCSDFVARRFQKNGFPVHYVPWGTMPEWYEDLGLQRDIDVLWMGNLRTRRRTVIFERIRKGLEARGVKLYVANNKENPFIFGDERTQILNRSKITLNLVPWENIWNFPQRFHVAAPNRSLLVTEPLFPHNPEYVAGEHYVAAPPDQMVDTIMYYLHHESQRNAIVENAYHLATRDMTVERSVNILLARVSEAAARKTEKVVLETAASR